MALQRPLHLLVSLLCVTIVAAPLAQAQRGGTVGEIDIESTDEQQLSYQERQDLLLSYFQQAQTPSAANPLRPLETWDGNYLAASLLYCSLRNGACPLIAWGVLESDIVLTAQTGTPQCPNTTRMWKAWLQADMERRLDYDLSIGLMNKANDFKQNQRPYFLKCKDAVTKIYQESGSGAALLENRYAPDGIGTTNLRRFSSFLNELKKKVPNVFVATDTK